MRDAEKNEEGAIPPLPGPEQPPGNPETGQSTNQTTPSDLSSTYNLLVFLSSNSEKGTPRPVPSPTSAQKLPILHLIHLRGQGLPQGHTIPAAELMKK